MPAAIRSTGPRGLEAHDMTKQSFLAGGIICLLLGFGACSKAPSAYCPIGTGVTWKYHVSVTTESGAETAGTLTITNLEMRTLAGKKVVPEKQQLELRGQSHYEFVYVINGRSGVYTFATQGPDDPEPIIQREPSYILKEPLRAGNSWQFTLSLANESVPATATIEDMDEAVDVPAGSFKHCIRVRIVGLAEHATSPEEYEWFAPNVGLVKAVLQGPDQMSFHLVSFVR